MFQRKFAALDTTDQRAPKKALIFEYNGCKRRVSTNQQIRISVNGESRPAQQGQSVRQLLESLNIPADRVAVELNRRIVKPAAWEETQLEDGAVLEIVQFVGGG
jgi:sulfur carrier protein